MSDALRARRERMDLQKQAHASLSFYAVTNGPKRNELLQQVRDLSCLIHVECEQATAAAVKSFKRYRCNSAGVLVSFKQLRLMKMMFCLKEMGGRPPGVSLDEHSQDIMLLIVFELIGMYSLEIVFPEDDELRWWHGCAIGRVMKAMVGTWA